MAKESKIAQKFIEKRMHTFKEGGMHSRTKKGPVVENPKQAIAISLSEAREKGMKVSPQKGDKMHHKKEAHKEHEHKKEHKKEEHHHEKMGLKAKIGSHAHKKHK